VDVFGGGGRNGETDENVRRNNSRGRVYEVDDERRNAEQKHENHLHTDRHHLTTIIIIIIIIIIITDTFKCGLTDYILFE